MPEQPSIAQDPPNKALKGLVKRAMNCRMSLLIKDILLRIKALRQVKLFQALNDREIEEAAVALDLVFFEKGDYVIKQGEQGSDFYMVDEGECVVEVNGNVVFKYTDEGNFGERALLRDEPRAASIKVTSETLSCFRMSQTAFKKIMMMRITALQKVPLFQSLNRSEVEKAAEKLEMVSFKDGDYVINQGEQGSDFFMVDHGDCVVEVNGNVVHKFSGSGSFGEGALLSGEPRMASIKVTSETLVCFRMTQKVFKEIMAERIQLLRGVKLFKSLGSREIGEAAEALVLISYKKGDYVIKKGEQGTEFFIVDHGQCAVEVNGNDVFTYTDGGSFGERSLLRDEPRSASIRVTSDTLVCFRISQKVFKGIIENRDGKEHLIKNCPLFETMSDDHVAILAGAFKRVRYPVFPGAPPIIEQGGFVDENSKFYLLERGECVATILQPDGTEQEVKSYRTGEIFGEKALMESKARGASIRIKMMTKSMSQSALAGAAIQEGEKTELVDGSNSKEIVVLELSRAEFEKQLGPLSQLTATQYNSDPRKLLADFYRKGDVNGPKGTLPEKATNSTASSSPSTNWFAVYRPCSKESIAKMIGKVGVGKGLNVKGKSAKMNRLSGFVPFVQVSDNAHKSQIEEAPTDPGYDIHIYYRNASSRDEAKKALENFRGKMVLSKEEVKSPSPMKFLTEYEDDASEAAFGLTVPEYLFREFYLIQPDLSPMLGWETGRASQPAFLNFNLHTVRMEKDGTAPSDPPACLYQFDKGDPLNPSGLLVAYAEEIHVKPVVSDFDTFLIGSQGAKPFEDLIDEQRALMMWSLSKMEKVLLDKNGGIGDKDHFNWTGAWLSKVLDPKVKKLDPFKVPAMPRFGFGDPTSLSLINAVVDKLAECGAVRHGAECFNYYFPQELDEEFLVVWDGYENITGRPWESLNEQNLIKFLSERVDEDFSFPLNPVWMVRDGKNGWSDLFDQMLNNNHTNDRIKCWYNQETIDKIKELSQRVKDISS
mmetsp:Transcript_26849/g.32943  ORF Transcript_26849/g.32943 Transcript_26849/m.32943 type:complete len:996 (+) Transcript_26849:194-3181(+)